MTLEISSDHSHEFDEKFLTKKRLKLNIMIPFFRKTNCTPTF